MIDIFKSQNLKLFFRNYKTIIFLLFFFLFFNLIVSINWQFTLRGQLGLLKHIFLYFALIHFFFKKESNFELLIKMFFFSVLFVLVDSYIQFFFDKDLFGHKVSDNHGRRLSGPFGDEYIGEVYFKTIFITKYNKYFENNYNWLVYLLISFILVILASQRMPALMLSTSLIILFLIEGKINLKSKISIFLISLLCLLLLIFNYNSK